MKNGNRKTDLFFCRKPSLFGATARFLLGILFFVLDPALSRAAFFEGTLRGYVKEMTVFSTSGNGDDASFHNLVHSRLNLRWFASESWTAAVEMRTQLFSGETVKEQPSFRENLDRDPGVVDLKQVWTRASSTLLQADVDRLWLEWIKGPLQVRLGRQRVNWAINYVWNPNDLFHTFSYLDFDYEERPGADALRIQYYTGVTSLFEAVHAFESDTVPASTGLMYRWNRMETDFQLFVGRSQKTDVLGAGFASQILDGGFRGEISWFHPETGDQQLVAAFSYDYTFPNSLFLHAECLYNESGTTGNAGSRDWSATLTPRTLSPARFSLFGQAAYDFSALIRGSLSGIWNPNDHSWYLGPELSWSIRPDIDLLVFCQIFQGETDTEFGGLDDLVFLRLKWSF